MNVEPKQVVHIGDNWQFDFLNSKQIGMHAFYLDRSGRNHQEYISDLTQLKPLLLA
jgi:FMN phosphatase YigB (HAD superfamily)